MEHIICDAFIKIAISSILEQNKKIIISYRYSVNVTYMKTMNCEIDDHSVSYITVSPSKLNGNLWKV